MEVLLERVASLEVMVSDLVKWTNFQPGKITYFCKIVTITQPFFILHYLFCCESYFINLSISFLL